MKFIFYIDYNKLCRGYGYAVYYLGIGYPIFNDAICTEPFHCLLDLIPFFFFFT